MNSLGFTNIYTRIMGMTTINKDSQFANPNTAEQPSSPQSTHTTHHTTKNTPVKKFNIQNK